MPNPSKRVGLVPNPSQHPVYRVGEKQRATQEWEFTLNAFAICAFSNMGILSTRCFSGKDGAGGARKSCENYGGLRAARTSDIAFQPFELLFDRLRVSLGRI